MLGVVSLFTKVHLYSTQCNTISFYAFLRHRGQLFCAITHSSLHGSPHHFQNQLEPLSRKTHFSCGLYGIHRFLVPSGMIACQPNKNVRYIIQAAYLSTVKPVYLSNIEKQKCQPLSVTDAVSNRLIQPYPVRP